MRCHYCPAMKLDQNTSHSASQPDSRIRQYLDFDRPKSGFAPQPAKSDIPPVVLLKEHLPKTLKTIEALWGTIELHRHFQKLLSLGRKGKGAPLVDEVMGALTELNDENWAVLTHRKIKPFDIQDEQIEH